MIAFRNYNDRSDELCYRCGKPAKFDDQWGSEKQRWGGFWMRFKCECGQIIDRPTEPPVEPQQPEELTW